MYFFWSFCHRTQFVAVNGHWVGHYSLVKITVGKMIGFFWIFSGFSSKNWPFLVFLKRFYQHRS